MQNFLARVFPRFLLFFYVLSQALGEDAEITDCALYRSAHFILTFANYHTFLNAVRIRPLALGGGHALFLYHRV